MTDRVMLDEIQRDYEKRLEMERADRERAQRKLDITVRISVNGERQYGPEVRYVDQITDDYRERGQREPDEVERAHVVGCYCACEAGAPYECPCYQRCQREERERAAKVAEEYADSNFSQTATAIAAAIRRGGGL